MKTYQSGTKENKKNFFKRHWHALIVGAVVIAVALVITLSVALSKPKSEPVDGTVIDPPTEPADTEPKVQMPVKGATVGLEYAVNKLVYWDTLEIWKVHPAIDFVGEGNVVAILDGTVTDVEMHTTLDGNVVTVKHDNGYVSVYKSLGDNVTVKVGDKVKAGDKLGETSDSMMSELKTGAHLHLELKKNGQPVDPATVLPMNEDK